MNKVGSKETNRSKSILYWQFKTLYGLQKICWRTFVLHVCNLLDSVLDSPKINENEDSEVVEFIDKLITCALPDETKYLEINNLMK